MLCAIARGDLINIPPGANFGTHAGGKNGIVDIGMRIRTLQRALGRLSGFSKIEFPALNDVQLPSSYDQRLDHTKR